MSPTDFSRLFDAPIEKQLEPLKENSGASRRETLDAIEPGILFRKLAEGARSAKSAYASHLSDETYSLIDAYLTKAKQECEQAKSLWAQLDYYDRNGAWEGMKAGYSSGETQIGAVVGGFFFGGIGQVIGGALGGWVAGSRVDEHFQKGMQDYGNWLIHWGKELDDEFKNRILPSVQRDLDRPLPSASLPKALPSASQARGNKSTPFGLVVAGLLLLIGFSSAGWYYYEHSKSQTKARKDPPDDLKVTLDALQGKWLSDGSRGYEAVRVGDTIEFRLHNALDSQRDGYHSGEMHFRLRRINAIETGFAVEQKIRPILLSSLRYSNESLDSCQEIITTLDAQPLKANLIDDRLSIDMAKLVATPDILDTKRGQVLNCKNLQQAKTSKIQIALTRLPPGKDFPDPIAKLTQQRKSASKSSSAHTATIHLAPIVEERAEVSPKSESGSLEKDRSQGIGSNE